MKFARSFTLSAAAALAVPLGTAGLAQSAASPDLSTATAMSGNWAYAPTPDGSEARFADGYGHVQLSLHCTRATRRVSIVRPLNAAATSIAIWTGDGSRSLTANYDARAGLLSADFAAYDRFLDSIASSRGRFVVSIAGQPALVVPPWPEVARVIEDCRV
jgi:hypothetical protein